MMAGQQRTLSFSVERILRQPFGNGAVPSRTPGAHGISFQQASLPVSPRSQHPMYAYSFLAATPLMAQLLQQRSAMIAASPAFWGSRSYCAPNAFEYPATVLDGGVGTVYERDGVQMQRKNPSCRSVSPSLSTSSKEEEEEEEEEEVEKLEESEERGQGGRRREEWPRTRCKKKRTTFTSTQLQELESKFNKQKYLTKLDRCTLAQSLGLTEKHVKTWYQNRRTKWKRECTEETWSREREHAATNMYKQHLQLKSFRETVQSPLSQPDTLTVM